MDIDIDLPSSFNPLEYFPNIVQASMVKDGNLVKHPCGTYFQNMAKDPITGFAAVPYDVAEEIGYTKIDFLHLTILDQVETKDQVREMIKREPNWEMFKNPFIVERLFHLSKHYDLLQILQPTSIVEIADCLALIRPAKRHLLDRYIKDPKNTRRELYRTVENAGYQFKYSHAIAYANVIVLQMNILENEKDE